MQIDLRELGNYYASLSDEELADLDRTELTGAAQKCYDAEVAKRRPDAAGKVNPLEALDEEIGDEVEPDWIESAACAIAYAVLPGGSAATDADNARAILAAAGISCHVTLESLDPDDPKARQEYRVMVPGARNLEATSVLDLEIYNPEAEAMWRTHFEALSDKELRALKWEVICGGLQDRLDRLKRAFEDEIEHRGLR